MTHLSVKIERIKFFGNLLRFQLRIDTDDPEFRDPSFIVIRVYKDFVWLHDKLRNNKKYLGIYLPQLPVKLSLEDNKDHYSDTESHLSKLSIKSQERFEEELSINKNHEIKMCTQNHQQYLDELTSHPVLKKDQYFKIFLEYRDFLKGAVKHRKNTLYKEMDGLVASCLNSVPVVLAQDLDKYGSFRDLYEECGNLKALIQQNSEMTDHCENLCYSSAAFCIHFDDICRDREINELWDEYSWVFWALMEETRKSNQNMKEQLVHALNVNYSLVTAEKYLILSYYHGQLEYNDILHDIHRAEKHKNDLTQLTKDLEHHQQHMNDLDAIISPEMENLRRKNEEKFKSTLSSLCSSQLKSSKAIEEILQRALAEMPKK